MIGFEYVFINKVYKVYTEGNTLVFVTDGPEQEEYREIKVYGVHGSPGTHCCLHTRPGQRKAAPGRRKLYG